MKTSSNGKRIHLSWMLGLMMAMMGFSMVMAETADAACFGKRATIRGDAGNNYLQPHPNDTRDHVIVGKAGNDTLVGGSGNDRLCGGRGNDMIDGGGGYNRCAGGPGADTFRNCHVVVRP